MTRPPYACNENKGTGQYSVDSLGSAGASAAPKAGFVLTALRAAQALIQRDCCLHPRATRGTQSTETVQVTPSRVSHLSDLFSAGSLLPPTFRRLPPSSTAPAICKTL